MFLFRRSRREGRFAETFAALRAEQETLGFQWSRFDPHISEVGQRVLGLPPEERRAFVLAALERLEDNRRTYISEYSLYRVVIAVLKHRLPFGEGDLAYMLGWSRRQPYNHIRLVPQMIRAVENFLKEHELTPALGHEIGSLADAVVAGHANAEARRWYVRLRALGGLSGASIPLVAGEAWSDVAIAEIEAMEEERGAAWVSLLDHCTKAGGARPSATWQKTSRKLVERLGVGHFADAVTRWFPLVERPRNAVLPLTSEWMPDPNLLIEGTNADVLKGLAWTCALAASAQEGVGRDVARTLTRLAVSAYRKVPQQGPRCVRVGNACVWALGAMPGTEGISELAVLKAKVKFGSARKAIEKALSEAAGRSGIPLDEVEELSVPTYGFTGVGARREEFGDYVAEAVVVGTNAVELRWIRRDGRAQKSVPKAVKQGFAEELAAMKRTLKDVQQALPAQRDRIEGSYLGTRSWAYPAWRERYLDHPLVGTLARRLIWTFSGASGTVAGVFHDGHLVDRRGRPLDGLDASTRVELWHPIGESPDEVLAWRDWLAELQIKQPFKQAHREVYLLTDAERATGVYSNRFAAHFLRQHQFNALCAARGWKNKLRLMVDDDFPPASLDLAAWGLRAEFWIEGIGDDYGTDTNLTGTYLYLSTDQVRFYASGANENLAHAYGGGYVGYGIATASEPIPLESVPPLVFSETMRDVDLFVGVASVGNDPTWSDGGPEGRFRDYWAGYSFGNLSETAKTRREVLERVVPRLAIAGRCSFEERFLVVRGDLRTYRIHLGSGNILMKPNDQYLCIVTRRGLGDDAGGAILPFEGDGTLAVILSKAIMLAEDRKIQDPTIVRQIKVQ